MEFSSALNRCGIERIFVNQTANHMSVCKFPSEGHPTYKSVLWFLQDQCRNIEERQNKVREAVESSQRALQTGS
jgi:hypothetical protein